MSWQQDAASTHRIEEASASRVVLKRNWANHAIVGTICLVFSLPFVFLMTVVGGGGRADRLIAGTLATVCPLLGMASLATGLLRRNQRVVFDGSTRTVQTAGRSIPFAEIEEVHVDVAWHGSGRRKRQPIHHLLLRTRTRGEIRVMSSVQNDIVSEVAFKASQLLGAEK